MSSKRLDSIADYRRAGRNLRVECGCGRVVVLDSHRLTLDCPRTNRPKGIAQLVGRMRCGDCGGRVRDWGPV